MNVGGFCDAALVLLGHGTALNPDSSMAVRQHVAELRSRGLFAAVKEAFWKQDPQIEAVLKGLSAPRIFIVPVFMSEGYFSAQVIPRALGFAGEGNAPRFSPVQVRKEQTICYCNPVGTHRQMREVLLARAQEVVTAFPFPRMPDPRETTLCVAGHGTEKNGNSRKVIEQQVAWLEDLKLYAAVHAVFLEEDPRISEVYALARTQNIVVVPYFIGEGLHVTEDIPVLLGEPRREVETRLAAGSPAWRNPTQKHGKLVWYAQTVGTDARVADVILARVKEAAGNPPSSVRRSRRARADRKS